MPHPFSFLLFSRWIADTARHPGWVASRRGAGGRGLRRPLPPTTPYPALGAAIPDGQPGYARRTVVLLPAARQRAFVLPLSRAHAGRASVRRRSFRPCGAAISSAPCRAYVSKRNRRSRFASGTSSLAVGRGKRLSFVESVHCAGKWDALSVVDLVQRNKTGQASTCRERICPVMMYRPLLRSGETALPY